MKIVFATKNKGKFEEVKNIFLNSNLEILSLNDFDENIKIIEDGKSFVENALKKAKEIYTLFKVPVISDDSGLVVEQLDGAPGIYSARYSGENTTDEKNNLKLLKELKKHPPPHKAKFVCSAVYLDSENCIVTKGKFNGQIISAPKGINGFGYDPLFLPDGLENTSAELSPEIKNKISHRAKAFEKLKELLIKDKII